VFGSIILEFFFCLIQSHICGNDFLEFFFGQPEVVLGSTTSTSNFFLKNSHSYTLL